jgi:uncharacterized protein YxjI
VDARRSNSRSCLPCGIDVQATKRSRSIRARATCCARSCCRLRLWIENDQGERIFYVDGKVLRVRDTVLIKDRTGNELIKLQKRLLWARNTMAIERGADTVARVKKAIIAPLRDRFTSN